ncbi:putative disease resistance protein RGA4 [Cajanus cajan]|uniref:Disease resistance protein RGA4 n=1 Tax=Cajanus cajan TaxID=3821 RepID=A0A151SJI6_CAJCA|nr:putative disease resistance protein RGA4 [Cajanus cajan]KYP54962.1 Putative disease resistance protein RGA4 [Cajanus cajan]
MEAIAGIILQNLNTLAQEEFGIIWNLKDDVEQMKSTVSAIKAVLLDAEAKANNLQISNWMEELKDVLYDADDLLDDLSTEALKRKLMRGNKILRDVQIFFSHSNQIVYGSKLGHEIKAIQKRLDVIAKNKITLQLTDRPMETPISYREQRQTYSFVSKDEVIGREDENELLKSYLLDTNVTDNVSVVPIVGIGGLGKTTLAQLVYNDHAVQRRFQQKMWVCVSDEFDIKKIAQKMMGNDKNSEIEQVQQHLRSMIQGKKYLLVLDDVWNEDRELWLKLKSLIMEGGKGSMIIVTTRSRTVANIMGTHPPLFLKGLDLERSWKLFSQVAFDGGKEPNDRELLAIGRDIVKKCAGVPLAIRVIGSLLYSRNLGRSDWLYFKEVEFSKIDQEKDKIFAILKLSYDHLPSFLKNCFAYCSLFPKGFEFDKKTLIQLWVAEGFIQPSNDIRYEENVGHEYFMNLLSMSLFQDVTIDDYGDISTCKMHDLIHDLAQIVVGKEYATVEGIKENIGNRTRYLSSRTTLHFADTSSSSCTLRTLLVLGQKRFESNNFDRSHFRFLLSIKCLRVLTLCGLDIITIPKSIKVLKHLRYLDLSRNHFLVNLPPELTSLYNLQTLKLSQCFKLKKLPSDMNESLRHLELNDCGELTCMPSGLGQLTNLQTLTHFLLDCGGRRGNISELRGLNSLTGKLEIRWLDSLREHAAVVESSKVLVEKQHLQELELRWWNDGKEISEWPSWWGGGIAEPHLQEKENKRWLEDEKILEGLQPHDSIKKIVIDGYCGKTLPDWIGNLWSLKSLEIRNCIDLISLPEGIRNLSLQRLYIYNCSPVLETRCATINGEDWPKIAHIPAVLVWKGGSPLSTKRGSPERPMTP